MIVPVSNLQRPQAFFLVHLSIISVPYGDVRQHHRGNLASVRSAKSAPRPFVWFFVQPVNDS